MKVFLLAALMMSGAADAGLLYFKTVTKCSAVKVSGFKLLIQKAQDGQTQIVVQENGKESFSVQVKELEAQGRMGAPITYVGSDATGKLALTISTRYITVGKVTGRASSLTVDPVFSNRAMVCSSVK